MKALKNNVIIKIDVRQKEKYNLTPDTQIFIERNYNFNLREDRAAMGYVVDGGGYPVGSQILIHYLAMEQHHEILSENLLTKEEKKEGFKVISIEEDMCFAYVVNGEWEPCKDYFITSRVFKPYKGIMDGVPHEQVKNILYIHKGVDNYDGQDKDLSGKVAHVTPFSDYEIIWHNTKNREERLIRTRHRELMAIDEGLTKKVESGELLIGFTPDNCSKLNAK